MLLNLVLGFKIRCILRHAATLMIRSLSPQLIISKPWILRTVTLVGFRGWSSARHVRLQFVVYRGRISGFSHELGVWESLGKMHCGNLAITPASCPRVMDSLPTKGSTVQRDGFQFPGHAQQLHIPFAFVSYEHFCIIS